MKPTVVLYVRSEQTAAQWRFLLETSGYKVQAAYSEPDAITKAREAVAIVCEPCAIVAPVPVVKALRNVSAVELLERVRISLR